MTRRQLSAGWERAVEARDQWEQAIAAGRDHAFIAAKWDAYVRITELYHGRGLLESIEKWVAAGRPD